MISLNALKLLTAAFAAHKLWEKRDRSQVDALIGVVRKKPVLYRVTLNREPMLSIHGDGAKIIETNLSGFGTGINIEGGL